MFGRATITLGIGPHSSFVYLRRHLYVQATIALCAIVACGVNQSNAAQRIPVHQFVNCHRARPAAAVRYRTWVN